MHDCGLTQFFDDILDSFAEPQEVKKAKRVREVTMSIFAA